MEQEYASASGPGADSELARPLRHGQERTTWETKEREYRDTNLNEKYFEVLSVS